MALFSSLHLCISASLRLCVLNYLSVFGITCQGGAKSHSRQQANGSPRIRKLTPYRISAINAKLF
jgi:hypothetical protein